MSLSSHTVAESPVAWSEVKTRTQEKVPRSRQVTAVPDEKALPEPR